MPNGAGSGYPALPNGYTVDLDNGEMTVLERAVSLSHDPEDPSTYAYLTVKDIVSPETYERVEAAKAEAEKAETVSAEAMAEYYRLMALIEEEKKRSAELEQKAALTQAYIDGLQEGGVPTTLFPPVTIPSPTIPTDPFKQLKTTITYAGIGVVMILILVLAIGVAI